MCVCVCAFQSVPRYDEYRSSVTVSDLRLRDILSGLDTRQFTVPDGADFHLFKVNIYIYSPWSEREIWPFLRVVVSPKTEMPRPPKLVCMHLTSIPTCMIFLSLFRSIKFFDDHGLYI